MALRISTDTPYNITCDEAHCIIRNARFEKQKAEYEITAAGVENEIQPATCDVQYSGLVYATEEAYDDGGSPVGGFNFSFPLITNEGKTQYNLLKQAYLHLKEQEGYQDGEDC